MMRLLAALVVVFLLPALPARAQRPVVFEAPTGYAKRFLANDSLPLQSVNHGNFRLYFREDSYAARHLEYLTRELDDAYARILQVLQAPTYERGIHLLAVDSEEDMQQLLGLHIKGGEAVGDHLVFFVVNERIRPQFRHEIFHLIAYQLWGLYSNRVLDEGGATFTDNTCFYDNAIYAINRKLLEEKKLYRTADLVEDFGAQAKKSDVIAYLQAAGMVKYLYDRYGVKRFRRLWEEGFGQFEAIYGQKLGAFDKEWRRYLQTLPPAPEVDLGKLMKEGCG